MIKKEKLIKVVGAGNVSDDRSDLDTYSEDKSFVNAVRPQYVVKPRNTSDIEKLVKLANETQTPLVPVSSGPPHFRGDTVPSIGGAVIVDLSGMNKIIRVDREHRVAMVEPGVTFEDLIPAVKKEGIRLNMPLLPRKSKTVIGSMLEREPVIMPKYQWDISDPLACLEVVFGTGDTFRTGQAAGPGTIEEQWAAGGAQKAPYGPGPASWYKLFVGAQGTMGIVTWASLRCELLPRVEEPFLVGSSDINRLFELTQWMIRLRLVNECFIVNNSDLASIMARKGAGDYQALKDSLPPWVLFYNVAGYEYFPEDRVGSQIKGITDITKRVGVDATKAIGGVSATELMKEVQRTSAEPYWKLRRKGACHDVLFLTIYDKLENQIEIMYDLVNKHGYPASDLGVYIQPIVQGVNCHCEFNLFYDPENQKERERVEALSTLAVKTLMSHGAFFSRPYDKSARMIMNRDAASIAALNKVKNLLDPNNVMNPGKLCF